MTAPIKPNPHASLSTLYAASPRHFSMLGIACMPELRGAGAGGAVSGNPDGGGRWGAPGDGGAGGRIELLLSSGEAGAAACEELRTLPVRAVRRGPERAAPLPGLPASGRRKGKLKQLENQRTLYDSLSITLGADTDADLLFTLVTAPATVYIVIRHWKSTGSIVGRSRWRWWWR